MDLQKYKSPRSGDGIQVVWVAVAEVIFIHFYTLEHNESAYSQLILLESRLRGWRSLVPIAELHSLDLFATMQWTVKWVQFNWVQSSGVANQSNWNGRFGNVDCKRSKSSCTSTSSSAQGVVSSQTTTNSKWVGVLRSPLETHLTVDPSFCHCCHPSCRPPPPLPSFCWALSEQERLLHFQIRHWPSSDICIRVVSLNWFLGKTWQGFSEESFRCISVFEFEFWENGRAGLKSYTKSTQQLVISRKIHRNGGIYN